MFCLDKHSSEGNYNTDIAEYTQVTVEAQGPLVCKGFCVVMVMGTNKSNNTSLHYNVNEMSIKIVLMYLNF